VSRAALDRASRKLLNVALRTDYTVGHVVLVTTWNKKLSFT